MSLIVNDRASERQLEALQNAGYIGNLNISMTDAAALLDELYSQKKQEAAVQYIEFEGMQIEVF
jgi:hypothetical protein